ncbi:MAG: NAD(P)H-dependent oxidoreductase subunit E [Candidatus Kerfeldbacteria bacterium]|nr:NAD(P)H-dependent oxidoreductase subunit E [Candidatus Kerfeldbacteria bacterium]
MLRKITVCQNIVCQNKGSKAVLYRLQSEYDEKFRSKYPQLQIQVGDCMGDCEQGPIVKVNDAILLRGADNAMMLRLLENPEEVLGQVMHVLEEDRETFERIVKGELF